MTFTTKPISVACVRNSGLRWRWKAILNWAPTFWRRWQRVQADFTLTFRALSEAAADPKRDMDARALFANPAALDEWMKQWRERLSREDQSPEARRASMRAVNPMFIPRNHRVDVAIADAEAGRFDKFHELVDVLRHPYEDQLGFADYAKPPTPEEEVQQTFCGT